MMVIRPRAGGAGQGAAGLGELTVVAPETNHSGVDSLTLNRPLSVRTASNGFIAVNGTPSDCVHVALTGLMDVRPDLVVSGINNGANMGDDTLFGHRGRRQRRLSVRHPRDRLLARREGLGTSNRRPAPVVERHLVQPLAPPVLLNVNIPNRRFEDLHGFQVTRLGKRHPSQPVVRTTPYGDTVYWIGPVGSAADAAPGTDFHAVEQGLVSVTPLRLDLTQHSQLDEIRGWAEPLCASA